LIDSEKKVCLDCGLVVHEYPKKDSDIDVEKDANRIFGAYNKTGESLNLRNVNGTHTFTTRKHGNLYYKWEKVAKYNDSTEKNLVHALSEITKIGGNLNMPLNVLERASLNYRKLIEKRLLKRNKIRLLCVATLYLACRQTNYSISMGEMARVTGFKKKDIGKSLKLLTRELKFPLPPCRINVKIQQNPSKRINRDEATIMNMILDTASKIGITIGKNPEGLSASAHYIASHLMGEIRTQRELSELYNITQTTIRNRYTEFVKLLNIVITL
jgi:transcription initiation factor TFIIB